MTINKKLIKIIRAIYKFHLKHLWKIIFAYLTVVGLIVAIIGRTSLKSVPVVLTGGIIMVVSIIIIYAFWISGQIQALKQKHKTSGHNFLKNDAKIAGVKEDERFYKNIANLRTKINLDKIKLIVCDLDGTLLNHNGFVSWTSVKLLKEFMLKKPDIMFVPATGRDYFTTQKALVDNFDLKYVICNNGAVLTEWKTFKPIFESPIRSVYVQDLFDYTLIHDIHAIVYADEGEVLIHNCCVAKTTWFAGWINQYQLSKKPIEESTKIYQCGVWVPRYIVPDFVKHVKENYALELYHYPHLDFIYFELTGNNVNKWTMIKSLCQQKGIKPSEILTIGNGNNDVKMITEAGFGVAVANAEQTLLDSCDIIIDRNYKDGVVRFLTSLL